MLHREKACLGMLLSAALLAGGMSGQAQAAIGGGDLAFPENTQPGQTAVGVQVTGANLDVLSYEVPLYVTLAVVEDGGQTKVICPDADAYYIENTSPNRPDGQETAMAVTEVTLSSVTGGTWSLVERPRQAGEISLSVGGLALPTLAAGAGTSSTLETAKAGGSAFYTEKVGYVKLVGDQRRLPLPITGQAMAMGTESKPAAQFRLSYTVSLLDTNGAPIGVFTDSPERT